MVSHIKYQDIVHRECSSFCGSALLKYFACELTQPWDRKKTELWMELVTRQNSRLEGQWADSEHVLVGTCSELQKCTSKSMSQAAVLSGSLMHFSKCFCPQCVDLGMNVLSVEVLLLQGWS